MSTRDVLTSAAADLTPSQREAVEHWLSSSSAEELFEELARREGGDAAFPGESRARLARRLLAARTARWQSDICASPIVDALARRPPRNVDDLIAAFALVPNLLPSPANGGLTVFLVLALICRIGVRAFCDGTWKD